MIGLTAAASQKESLMNIHPILERSSGRIAAAGPGLGGLAATGLVVLATAVMRAGIPLDYYWAAVGGCACLGALSLVRLLEGLAGVPAGTGPGVPRRVPPDARQFLDAFVYGTGIDELEAAALAEAMALYGPDARLEVVRMNALSTSSLSGKGSFCTHVMVRCLDFPEEDQ
jgi:hypothetical protein